MPQADPSEADTLIEEPLPEAEPPHRHESPPRPPELGPELPESPVIGRIATSWRRRLSEVGWPRPAYAADGGRLGDFEVLAASAVGQGHLHRDQPRQDAYELASAADGIVLAIADGVSAKPLAAIGAETAAFVATRTYVELARMQASTPELAGRQTGEWLGAAVEEAAAAVRATAAELAVAPRDLSTTLLVAHLAPARSGSATVTVIAVGDSSALAISEGDPPEVIHGPEERSRHSANDAFLPGRPQAARLVTVSLPPAVALVLATDGLAADLHASPAVRAWLWDRLGSSRSPIEFAYSLAYRRQGSADDLTAVVARVVER